MKSSHVQIENNYFVNVYVYVFMNGRQRAKVRYVSLCAHTVFFYLTYCMKFSSCCLNVQCIVFKAMTCSTVCMSSRLDIKPNHLQVKYFNIQSCLHYIMVEFKILYQLVSAHTLYIILKCPCDQKNHFLFFFSL